MAGRGWIFQPEYERMARPELESLQLSRLKWLVGYLRENSPAYQDKLKEISPDKLKGLEDVRKLPFTTKEELRREYPWGYLCVGLDRILEVHASSGTTGKPIVVAYTQGDLDVWSTVMARVYASCGVKKGDIIQNAYGYGLFTGGLGFHYGALKIGAAVLPTSAGGTERQLLLAKELGTTVLCCTPSYAAYLGEYAREKLGMDPAKDLKLRVGIFGAEPWGEGLRRRIQDSLGLEAYDIYGLSEIIGPGVSVECDERQGLHVFEDHFLVEVVDPVTGEPVAEGERGELVLTTLTKEATPLLRFRTGDLTTFTTEKCGCGRTIGRMGRLLGRTDDMLKVKGIKFWPKAIEEAVLSVEGASENYRIIVDRPGPLDLLTVEVEPDADLYRREGGDLDRLHYLKDALTKRISSAIGITPSVVLLPPGSLQRFEGKAKRVIDRRPVPF